MAIDGIVIGVTAALCYPSAIAGTKNRLNRGDQTTSWNCHRYLIAPPVMDVRLAIRNHEEIAAIQLGTNMIGQTLGCPKRLVRISEPRFDFCGSTCPAHIFCKR